MQISEWLWLSLNHIIRLWYFGLNMILQYSNYALYLNLRSNHLSLKNNCICDHFVMWQLLCSTSVISLFMKVKLTVVGAMKTSLHLHHLSVRDCRWINESSSGTCGMTFSDEWQRKVFLNHWCWCALIMQWQLIGAKEHLGLFVFASAFLWGSWAMVFTILQSFALHYIPNYFLKHEFEIDF